MSERLRFISKAEKIKGIVEDNQDKCKTCRNLVKELIKRNYDQDLEDENNVFNNIFSAAIKFNETGDAQAWNKIEELVKKL